MGAKIYDSVRFYKKLHKLQSTGGKASDAALRAMQIIRELAERSDLSMDLRNKLRPSGDARIEKCAKFDLGSGYRLVYMKKHGWFVFLYLGTHGECDTWMNNNTGIRPDISKAQPLTGAGNSLHAGKQELKPEEPMDCNDMDIPLHEILDQKTLEQIFRGISGCSDGS